MHLGRYICPKSPSRPLSVVTPTPNGVAMQVPALSSASAWRIAALYAPATATIAVGILKPLDCDSATTGRSLQCSRFSFEKAVFPLTGSNFIFMRSLALRISRLLREHCLTSKLAEVSCQSQRSHLGPSRSSAALLSPMRKRVCQKLSIGDSVLIGMRLHPSDTARGRGNASPKRLANLIDRKPADVGKHVVRQDAQCGCTMTAGCFLPRTCCVSIKRAIY
jgi:hypothetical protein